MNDYLLFDEANNRLDEILDYTRKSWGEEQAVRYLDGLLARFEAIAARAAPWRTIPRQFGVDGFMARYERHFIYWRIVGEQVAIVTLLHERMNQMDLLHDAFEAKS